MLVGKKKKRSLLIFLEWWLVMDTVLAFAQAIANTR